MLDTSDVLVVLDQLDRAGLMVWLDGGWGVDALLGRHSRPHQDLDLVIARDDCAVAQEAPGAPTRRRG
jgi:lincosamide nucleotidyltransferase A/C/D/E